MKIFRIAVIAVKLLSKKLSKVTDLPIYLRNYFINISSVALGFFAVGQFAVGTGTVRCPYGSS